MEATCARARTHARAHMHTDGAYPWMCGSGVCSAESLPSASEKAALRWKCGAGRAPWSPLCPQVTLPVKQTVSLKTAVCAAGVGSSLKCSELCLSFWQGHFGSWIHAACTVVLAAYCLTLCFLDEHKHSFLIPVFFPLLFWWHEEYNDCDVCVRTSNVAVVKPFRHACIPLLLFQVEPEVCVFLGNSLHMLVL